MGALKLATLAASIILGGLLIAQGQLEAGAGIITAGFSSASALKRE